MTAIAASNTVLLVDRDPHFRLLAERFLTDAGYAVEFADDGVAALDRVNASPPFAVVTEILVPRLDGLALCRCIKKESQTSAVAVIIFSILTAGQRARQAGADAFLLKPLQKARLLDILQKLRDRRAAMSDGKTGNA